MKILIVGYGRAGQRHYKRLSEYPDTEIHRMDPYQEGTEYQLLKPALAWRPDVAIIASPPANHVEQAFLAQEQNTFVLCEKPLCAWDQLELAQKVLRPYSLMFAFNWRFHPTWNNLGHVAQKHDANWEVYSKQYRPKTEHPTWGFLLDHVSHSLDMLLFRSNRRPEVEQATHQLSDHATEWTIRGHIGDESFQITDITSDKPCPRKTYLIHNNLQWELEPVSQMFDNMYEYMFNGLKSHWKSFHPTLGAALFTQGALEHAHELSL